MQSSITFEILLNIRRICTIIVIVILKYVHNDTLSTCKVIVFNELLKGIHATSFW